MPFQIVVNDDPKVPQTAVAIVTIPFQSPEKNELMPPHIEEAVLETLAQLLDKSEDKPFHASLAPLVMPLQSPEKNDPKPLQADFALLTVPFHAELAPLVMPLQRLPKNDLVVSHPFCTPLEALLKVLVIPLHNPLKNEARPFHILFRLETNSDQIFWPVFVLVKKYASPATTAAIAATSSTHGFAAETA
jgi:hypothetical protein